MLKKTKTLRLNSLTLRQLTTIGLSEIIGGAKARTVIADDCTGPPAPNSNGGGCSPEPPPIGDDLLKRA